MPFSPPVPVVFCAPTLAAARRAAWEHVCQNAPTQPLEIPLVLASPTSFGTWRALASERARGALRLPRLVAPELFFARAHGANARASWLGGVPRLWALSGVLARLENGFAHLDFDADDTQNLRAMAASVAAMRRQCLPALPATNDPFGRELDQWRAAYDAYLEDANCFDFEAAPALFARSVEANRAFAFPKTLVADDLFEIFPALERGLDALMSRAEIVCATLALPNHWNDETANRARAFWTKRGARFVFTGEEPDARLLAARALLSDSDVKTPPPDVCLWQGHTPHDEWERIAAHIRARLNEGAAPRDFCLVLPSLSAQGPLMRAALEAHGVPLDGREGEGDSPLVERLLRLLAPSKTLRIDALHDLFGDGALRLQGTNESGAHRFDAGRLRRAHRSTRGESDEAAWRDPLALSRDWEARVARLRDAASGRGDETRAALLAASLDGGDLEGVTRLKELLAPLQSPQSARDWANSSFALLDVVCAHINPGASEQNVGDSEQNVGAAEQSNGDSEQNVSANEQSVGANERIDGHRNDSFDADILRRARQSVETLRLAIESVAARASDEDEARAANRWVAWLRLELAGGARDDYDASCEGVRVLSAAQAGEAGAQGEHEVFIAGLSERAWPAPAPPSVWPLATALSLEPLHAGEPAPLARALHGLARVLATKARVSLSHPAWLDGGESEASPLIEDVRALFPGASWPEIARADTYARPSSRSLWLRRQNQLRRMEADGENPARFVGHEPNPTRPMNDLVAPSSGGRENLALSFTDGPNHARQLAEDEQNPLHRDENSNAAPLQEPDGELNARLRALDAMRSGRANAHEFGRYDGVLGERGRELLAPLLTRDGNRLQLSASGAENYARCGIRFFFERALELSDEIRAEDDLSRAESGDLIHRVLHVFRREWSEPLGLENFERARDALEVHVRRECQRLGLPPILRRAEARKLLGTPRRDGALVRLLRAECLDADAGENGVFAGARHPLALLQSGRVESSSGFGFELGAPGDGLEQGFQLPLDGVVVRGRIDRMDAAPDGSWVLVVDYKTGSAAALPALGKGSDRLHFQLAVYALAARHLTSDWPRTPHIASTYLSPRTGFAGVLAPPETLSPTRQNSAMSAGFQEQWLSDARAQIERIAGLIESGTFNLSLRPVKVARCEWCAHKTICGQNVAIQSARAGAQLGSNAVFFPEAVEWK